MKRKERAWALFTSLIIFLSCCFYANAQEQRKITLEEAINLSIKNSKQLKGSQARIEEATAVLKQANEARLPDAKASGSYMRLNNPNVDLKIKLNQNNSGGNNSGSGGSAKVSQA